MLLEIRIAENRPASAGNGAGRFTCGFSESVLLSAREFGYAVEMPLQPVDWSVVVLGGWNVTIFTPAGISQKIFGLDKNVPVQVYVPIDEISPPRIKHDGIMVTVAPGMMQMVLDRCTFSEVAKARELVARTIDGYSKTPLSAAGVTLIYRSNELPGSLATRFSTELDGRFADQNFKIVGRQFQRILDFYDGRLLVSVSADPEKAEVIVNFERRSTDWNVVSEWLRIPIEDLADKAQQVLQGSLGLTEVDYAFQHGQNVAVEQPAVNQG